MCPMSGKGALMVFSVVKAQRTTTLLRAQHEDFSWTWNLSGDLAWPHDLEGCFARCALDVVDADECCDGVVD